MSTQNTDENEIIDLSQVMEWPKNDTFEVEHVTDGNLKYDLWLPRDKNQ